MLTKVASDLVNMGLNELKKDENQKQIKELVVSPMITFAISCLQPYIFTLITLLSVLIFIIFVMLIYVIIFMNKISGVLLTQAVQVK